MSRVWSGSWTNLNTKSVADLRGGGAGDARPPGDWIFFNFMQFLGNFNKIISGCPPWGLAPPPKGNPGSATESQSSCQASHRAPSGNGTSHLHLSMTTCGSILNPRSLIPRYDNFSTLKSYFPSIQGHSQHYFGLTDGIFIYIGYLGDFLSLLVESIEIYFAGQLTATMESRGNDDYDIDTSVRMQFSTYLF